MLTSLPTIVPYFGYACASLLQNTMNVRKSSLIHFYTIHIFVLPLLLIVSLLTHFLIIRKQDIPGPIEQGEYIKKIFLNL